ncbi:MAG: hypothetical protein KA393_03870 [Limnohabitans sp.]|nr:hypothetical protein [Limnohabitans sp.]
MKNTTPTDTTPHANDKARDSDDYAKTFGPRLLALAEDQLSPLCGDKAPTAENVIQHAQTLALLGVAQSLDDTGERIGGAVGDLSNAVFGLGR